MPGRPCLLFLSHSKLTHFQERWNLPQEKTDRFYIPCTLLKFEWMLLSRLDPGHSHCGRNAAASTENNLLNTGATIAVSRRKYYIISMTVRI